MLCSSLIKTVDSPRRSKSKLQLDSQRNRSKLHRLDQTVSQDRSIPFSQKAQQAGQGALGYKDVLVRGLDVLTVPHLCKRTLCWCRSDRQLQVKLQTKVANSCADESLPAAFKAAYPALALCCPCDQCQQPPSAVVVTGAQGSTLTASTFAVHN